LCSLLIEVLYMGREYELEKVLKQCKNLFDLKRFSQNIQDIYCTTVSQLIYLNKALTYDILRSYLDMKALKLHIYTHNAYKLLIKSTIQF